jgi:hypothetical protein
MIIEYRHCQLALIQNPTPPPPAAPVSTPTPSLNVVHIFSLEPKAIPTPPWFLDDLYEDLPPNPPNSPIHFPTEILHLTTTVFNPQYLDIWFMSSEPSQPPCDTPSPSLLPKRKPTVTVTENTPLDPLYFRQFHYDKDILKELTKPNFPWDTLHHRALFPSQKSFIHPNQNPIYTVETKYFLPPRHIDWFKNPIPTPNAFEEGNMANISPTIKIDISIKSRVSEEITIGTTCSPGEITAYKSLFHDY